MSIRLSKLPSPNSPEAILLRKCKRTLTSHRSRAKQDGVVPDYGLRDLLTLARAVTCCHYCRMPLGWDWQVDHMTPVARTSRAHALANLCICCGPCNAAKGCLSAQEFLQLLATLNVFHPQAQTDVLRRLRAGGKRYQKRGK